MKRMIVSSSISQDVAKIHARVILQRGKDLLDALENTPSGFIDANDLGQLYEELIEDLPALDFAIKSNQVAYKKDKYGMISPDGEEQ